MSYNQHGARGVSGNKIRGTSQQDLGEHAVPFGTDHNEVRFALFGISDNLVSGMPDLWCMRGNAARLGKYCGYSLIILKCICCFPLANFLCSSDGVDARGRMPRDGNHRQLTAPANGQPRKPANRMFGVCRTVSRQDNSHGSALISFGERNACDSSFLSVQPWLQSKRCAARWTSECRVFWRLFCHPSRVYVSDFFFKLERIQVCIQCSRQTSTCAIRHKIEMRVRFRTIFDLVSLL